MNSRGVFCCGVLGFLSVVCVPQVGAQTTHDVTLSGFDFTPEELTIDVGDTVHWVWSSGTHNVVSGVGGVHDGNFNSSAATFGITFDVIFDQTFLNGNPMPNNEYPYYCEPHLVYGMIGKITVQAGPPTGACCDASTGNCDPGILQANCQAPLEWTEGAPCSAVVCESPAVPAVSTWGMIGLAVLVFAAAGALFARRQAPSAAQ